MLPIVDDHLHLDPAGKGMEAVKEFQRSGGTHLFLVSKATWTRNVTPTSAEDYQRVYDETISLARRAGEHGVTAYPVLGVHPAEITQYDLEHAEVMKRGLELAAEYVAEGRAVALKSGRPHYDVPPQVWEASNDVMRHAMRLAADLDCALQLHTESLDEDGIREIGGMAREEGLQPPRLVKHYAPPLIRECREAGVWPSILASRDAIQQALGEGPGFTLETDYIDDPGRPGAVLGPRTVPRRTRELLREEVVSEESVWKVHKENIERVYGVEIRV